MLASTMILLSLLAGKPAGIGCVERCGTEMARCSGPCGQSQSCMDKCNRREQSCSNSCVAALEKDSDAARKKNQKLPCGVNEQTRLPIPCTEKELAEMKNQPKELKGMCKDDEGNPEPCPGEMAKLKEKMKKLGVDMDCKDSSGMPIECPPRK